MSLKSKRSSNRVLVLCASINDVTAWPFWKFLQMKKIKGVTDMAMLAFNSHGGSFEARIDGNQYTLKNYANVTGYRKDMLENFVNKWHDPGRSYFVYGGHGMGDYLELEQKQTALQIHELADILGRRKFEAIVFDACFMSNLDCAYYLRHNTQYIGACEGYMWEHDTALDYHIFNTHNASAMSRFKDPRHILQVIQRDYCSRAVRGDFSVLDTTHAAALRRFVQEHVIQRVYDRAALYTPSQKERLDTLAEAALQHSVAQFGIAGGECPPLSCLVTRRLSSSTPVESRTCANWHRRSRHHRLHQAVQLEHSLYPSETDDKHLIDLRSYLVDMAREEAGLVQSPRGRAPVWLTYEDPDRVAFPNQLSSKRPYQRSGSPHVAPPRSFSVDSHGKLPLLVTPPSSPVFSPSADSPFSRGSAHEGLDLFHKVVLDHVPPKAQQIYATHLGGLSVTVHEFSSMSKPLDAWRVNREHFNRRAREFLKKGFLSDVIAGPLGPAGSVAATATSGSLGSGATSAQGVCFPATRPADHSGDPIIRGLNDGLVHSSNVNGSSV